MITPVVPSQPEAGPAQSVVVVTDATVEGGPAIPVYGWTGQPTDGRPVEGAPAMRVKVITDLDLRENGGAYWLEGRPFAVPVCDSVIAPAVMQGNIAVPVYPVNAWAYFARVLRVAGDKLIGLWPGSELSGTVAVDLSGVAGNGSHVNVTVGQPGIGDGRTSCYYDGSTSYTNVLTAGLQAAFNGKELTIVAWPKAANAGVWTDGQIHTLYLFQLDGSNYTYIYKNVTNNQLTWGYSAGGTLKFVNYLGLGGNVSFNCLGLTVTKAGDAMKAWANATQLGSTQTGLGTWLAGSLVHAVIGAYSEVPGSPWLGNIGPVAVIARALTDAEMQWVTRLGP